MLAHSTLALALFLPASALANDLAVVSIEPALHSTTVAVDASVRITFDRAIDPASLPPGTMSVHALAGHSGVLTGAYALEDGGLTVVFDPDASLLAGEVVRVWVTPELQALDGATLPRSHAHRFRVVTAAALMNFTQVDEFSVRENNKHTRSGGVEAIDADEDGWPDLMVVNEKTWDVRVFPNTADGSGRFEPMLLPFEHVMWGPRRSAFADFDRDGHVDAAIGTAQASVVSVLFGAGDGTFDRLDVDTGSGPTGMATLDVDGDGIVDFATCLAGVDRVGTVRSDGAGGFSVGVKSFNAGVDERALSAGDMNEDGLDDLVVGLREGERIKVFLSNGDNTFTLASDVEAGGQVWTLVTGDVNGDGHLDVATTNLFGSATIALGDGAGGLTVEKVYTWAGLSANASDLGDLDGDGDLDWVISGRSHDWAVYENDGSGEMSLRQLFDAQYTGGDSALFDFDRDGDLDLALIDEISDRVRLLENDMPGTTLCFGDGAGSGCPCGNQTPSGSGQHCATSTGRGGVLLAAGSPSVALDDLELHGRAVPGQFGLVFSGTLEADVPFGDGRRCLGGSLLRYPVLQIGSDGSFTQPNIASLGMLSAGETRWFQGWFRDPTGPCGGTFNGTSAVRLTFEP